MTDRIDSERLKERLAQFVPARLEALGKNTWWLCQELNMSPGGLYAILNGSRMPRLDTTISICRALGVSLAELVGADFNCSRKPRKSA